MIQINRFLLGIVVWLGLVIFAINHKAIIVQEDLLGRVRAELKATGAPWVRVDVQGRDMVLRGMAPDIASKHSAVQKVAMVYGVRSVSDEIQTLALQSPYTLTIAKTDRTITITGYAPSEMTRGAVVDAVKAAIPGSIILDQQSYAGGAPPENLWILGIRFAAQQLLKLKSGEIKISDTNFVLSGQVAEVGGYEEIMAATRIAMPDGVRVDITGVHLPLSAPYSVKASLDARTIIVSGTIEHEHMRQALLARVKALFPNALVQDQLKLAQGAPRDFQRSAELAFDQLRTLIVGEVEVINENLRVAGIASSVEAYSALQKAVEGLQADISAVKLPAPSGQ